MDSFSIKTEEQYKKIINEVLDAKTRKVKTPTDCRRIKNYYVLKIGDCNKLIVPICKAGNNNVKYCVDNVELKTKIL